MFADIFKIFDDLSTELTAQNNPRGSFVGCLLRAAGHDFMDYRVDEEHQGGSDGCINFNDPDNAGLQKCLEFHEIPELYSNYKDHVSLADFIVIIAEAAMARSHSSYSASDPYEDGTLAQKFRDGFKFGRVTDEECSWN